MKLPQNLQSDIVSGLLVFLIALPLCLGISMASGVPPIAGILTAIVGGILVSLLGSSPLTIKGPAAGLIVIVLGCVTELGMGNMADGYRRMLAVAVIAGILQVVLALSKAGVAGELMPSAVVHGMLAAIGVIIISKQAHVVLGVSPEAKEPLELLAEIPHSIMHMNPEVFLIGLVSLLILFVLPQLKSPLIRRIPGPMLVLLAAVPLGLYLNLGDEHVYELFDHVYSIGPKFLIRLPHSLLGALTYPDFSMITSMTSIKYVVMFTLVGSIESLLSVTAVDALDPQRRNSNLNKDLLATGVGNTLVACIGGIPMISEIVRSKANIDAGAKTQWSNFFHGLFLLLSVAAIPTLLEKVPLAALAAMLIYTGTRLASPKEFMHVYRIGPEQLLLFVSTMLVTLATDLLVGVGFGLILKLLLHLKNGAPLRSLFQAVVTQERDGDTLILNVHDAAIFTNYLGLKRHLVNTPADVKTIVVNFDRAWVVDHTVLGKLSSLADRMTDKQLVLTGLDDHQPMSSHELSARRKSRQLLTA